MAYQLKYYYEFKSIDDKLHRVEIIHDTEENLTAVEITGATDPFLTEMPELSHKFQVVRGKGCTLRLLSETDGQFFDSLYHVGAKDMMVKHYINGSLQDSFFLDSEMMTEPYQESFNYVISVTGNDGFALMNRFSFLQSDETKYTGLKSKIELLQICLNKIGLWGEICVDLATTHSGVTTSILHDSYVDCANFYDEDDKPMSLREVIESVLAPYGAHIYTGFGRVYISDIHTKATKGTVNYLRYSLYNLSSLSTLNVSNVNQITADSYMGTGSNKEISGGVNRQVVSYSPYPIKTVVDKTIIGTEEFETIPETWNERYDFKFKTLEANEFWDEDSPAWFELTYYDNEKNADIHLTIPGGTDPGAVLATCKVNPWMSISGATPGHKVTTSGGRQRSRNKYMNGVAFLITGNVLLKTKNNPYADGKSPVDVMGFNMECVLKVGDRYYNQSSNSWETTPATFSLTTHDASHMPISDKFVPIGRTGNGIKIIIWDMDEEITINGNFEFQILSTYSHNTNTNVNFVGNSPSIKEIWINDLMVELVNFDESEIGDNDIEYVGDMDKAFQNEGEKITLTCGTDSLYADRGKILKYDGTNYSDIKEWTRSGQTCKIEELLLNSLCSNYRAGFLTISSLKLKNEFSIQNILMDECLPNRKFMVKSARINHWNNEAELSIVEIQPDSLIIVK